MLAHGRKLGNHTTTNATTQFAILSLLVLSPHPYNPLRSGPSFIPSHESSPHITPPESHEVPEDRPVEPGAPTHPDVPPLPNLENATLLMLTNSWEIEGALRVVSEVEERFNRKFNYPWIFLNDEPFSDEFERYVTRSPLSP